MKERFTGLEWLKLTRLPSVVYHAVASADGRTDQYEASRFLEYLTQNRTVDPLLRQVFDQAYEQGNDALRLAPQEQDYPTYVAEMRAVLEARLDPEERRSFLAGLLGMGHHVAAASGGFFGLGNKISATESRRLQELTGALGLAELL